MKQSTVQIRKILPLSWLVDYVSILREILKVDAPPELKVEGDDANRRIVKRIDEVQAYIDRLQKGQLN